MKNLNLLLLLLPAFLLGCSSPGEAVQALEKIHGLDREDGYSLSEGEENAGGPSARLYRSEIEIDADDEPEFIEDPVSFCKDQIEMLREADFHSEKELAGAACILAFTALNSPASLVRADALRTLRIVCKDQASAYDHADGSPAETGALEAEIERFRILCRNLSLSDDAAAGDGHEALAALFDYFRTVRLEKAAAAVDLLEALSGTETFVERKGSLAGLEEVTLRSVMAQTFFLAARQALFDMSPSVRDEAVDALALFDLPMILPPYTGLMRIVATASLIRIRILKVLRDKQPTPVELGPEMMKEVAFSLEFTDPSVVFHAVELLKTMTGTTNDDAGYWRSWWKEYLVEHVDELGDKE